MTSAEIRQAFLDFFQSKQHKIVPSAPMVLKNDPTLMFTNAGMNQFKDIFLGNAPGNTDKRIADSQKCLRASGKHNDLEDVGHDTYHHTMFEMLGNWSFGDYFKVEAINWAWEFLTEVLKIDKSRLYATVFEGDAKDNVSADEEAKALWKQYLPEERILYGNKKDNFWEMGDTGPCGPCSEIHVDLREDADLKKIPGRDLVNKDHHWVIEIWNLVFIQYNRKKGGALEQLPDKHVDTGMGFERLNMVVQGKKSNYDTDVFQPIIQQISQLSGKKYGQTRETDIAMRVVADHLRTVSFSITDGQLPSNTGAGYVIRRILRRAVRYAYTFLNATEPMIYKLSESLISVMGQAYPELVKQRDIVEKVIREEETTFLRTLETGIRLTEKLIEKAKAENQSQISGNDAFTLYDTYGFPLDLTELILRENGMTVNLPEFDAAMLVQKKRSKDAAAEDKDDWTVLIDNQAVEFIGYDNLTSEIRITRYRKVEDKKSVKYHLIFDKTPFYAESGGQAGDNGWIIDGENKTQIADTQKENNLIIHISETLPTNPSAVFRAEVNSPKRKLTMANHSATHLMHKALRDILGTHVEQKGSLVDEKRLRFDFSHFEKLSDEQIAETERRVNAEIRKNIYLDEKREMPINQAQAMGAMALFGEKYGDKVRVIKFGDSVELCGGTHVQATGEIGLFKIISESGIAAGIRRIEAVTSDEAENYINSELDELNKVRGLFKNSANLPALVEKLISDNKDLQKTIEQFEKEQLKSLKTSLKAKAETVNGITFIGAKVEVGNAGLLRDLAFMLKGEEANLCVVLACEIEGKANLAVLFSDDLVSNKKLNAGQVIREISKEIQGGGGGQANFASAGGKNPAGIDAAIAKAKGLL